MYNGITPAITKKATDALAAFGRLLPVVIVVTTIGAVAIMVVRLLVLVYDWRRFLRQPYVFLEITPPMAADKTPVATMELFGRLHGLGAPRGFKERLLRKQQTLALEIPATYGGGIRYIVCVPQRMATEAQSIIASYLPSARIAVAEDYLSLSDTQDGRIVEFTQRSPWPFPLKAHESLADHDSFAYLAGLMADLKPDERLALQVIVTPVDIPRSKEIVDKLMRNDDLLGQLNTNRATVYLQRAFGVINVVFSSMMSLLTTLFHDNTQHSLLIAEQEQRYKRDVMLRRKPARSIGSIEQELHDAMNDKAGQPLFRTDIRLLVIMDKERARQRTKAFAAIFAAFDTKYQSLRARYDLPMVRRYRRFVFKKRLPHFLPRRSSVLATSEIADIYHFPTTGTSTDSMVQSLSRTLPATLALKRGTNIDVLIGRNVHQGKTTPIGLSAPERARHIYAVGATGNGKTTLMKYSIIQDIQSGKGLAVLDPHGDMAEELLPYIPEERLNDVIYFNPDDLEYPVQLNMLEIDPSLTGDDLERAKYLMTEYTVEIFRKLFSDDDSGGSRIEAVLRNAIYTAFTTKDPTLFTLYRLITDKEYRKQVVADLDDEMLKNFWNNEFDAGGEYQRVKMGFGVTTKVGRFLTAVFVRRIMDSPKSTIDFDDIINSGKILICNLSKGNLVKDTSALFGTTIIARLQIAGQRRGKMAEGQRRPFYIYIDEFQNFATTTFVDMVSEARKFGLHLFMAEQSTSQQDQDVIYNILGNVGTVICFGTGNPLDEQLLLPRFEPWITRGQIVNLPSYNFFARIKAIGSSDSQAPVSGETVKIEVIRDEVKTKRVIAASRANYAKKYVPVPRVEAAGKAEDPKSINDMDSMTEQR